MFAGPRPAVGTVVVTPLEDRGQEGPPGAPPSLLGAQADELEVPVRRARMEPLHAQELADTLEPIAARTLVENTESIVSGLFGGRPVVTSVAVEGGADTGAVRRS